MAEKKARGVFTQLDGKDFYKIENFDRMEDFFMTVTSSSDVWNFCWSKGGVTAGRINSDHAVFPYYTADKVSDAKSYTGPCTLIAVLKEGKRILWEPFRELSPADLAKEAENPSVQRNLYKNKNGTMLWFEERNLALGLSFRYCWTSSELYGIVRKITVVNESSSSSDVQILDGAKNILPACCTSDFQNSNSVLLDAYKKTEWEEDANLALFTVSSIVTDKAEPNEALYANVCWFSCPEPVILEKEAPENFALLKPLANLKETKGRRPACFVSRNLKLNGNSSESWYMVFDTALDSSKIVSLKEELKDRKKILESLEADIEKGDALLESYISRADGIQHTDDLMACLHHRQNVLFNIMRGGIFADEGLIRTDDFVKFVSIRNKAEVKAAEELVRKVRSENLFTSAKALKDEALKTQDAQLLRLVTEYLPLTFSRRHGDPSRPWNRFNIKIKDSDGSPVLNYEGNWRDIFQNWEALVWSYPEYAENLCAKFLNAMTPDGFNPYRITKSGVDWEEPDPDNPWAQIGYWGDHQVIYLEKLLEFFSKKDRASLLSLLNKKSFSSSNVPYRLKPYSQIASNPRETIVFDRELSETLKKNAGIYGTDAKLVCSGGGQVKLVSLTTKLLQIVIAKMANFIPGGGIWLNTQRPEWNDANNALAGYGLSVVTLCYVYRYLDFIEALFADCEKTADSSVQFSLPKEVAECFVKLSSLFSGTDEKLVAQNPAGRKIFADKAGFIFEEEREKLYKDAFSYGEQTLSCKEILVALKAFKRHAEFTILQNKRPDGLYHSYNTMSIKEDSMEISYLQEMLEGQVAALSAGLLSSEQVLEIVRSLKNSRLYEKRQNAYMLYPNKRLPLFTEKNCIPEDDAPLLSKVKDNVLCNFIKKDKGGTLHFNAGFRNVSVMRDFMKTLPKEMQPSEGEKEILEQVYENTFNHQNFTGRSGTFFAYEGLGSIYWHMVSKLLLAIQENAAVASGKEKEELINAYYDVRSGLGFNKEPSLYGAFPADPYSHTPEAQGAKQPGMTGQVKEEILTRWGELGVDIKDGNAKFSPYLLKSQEFCKDGSLSFTWCKTKIVYKKAQEASLEIDFTDGTAKKIQGSVLDAQTGSLLFNRNNSIKQIVVSVLEKDLK